MDNSGIIHMVSIKPGMSNTFRLEARLKEPVRPDHLRGAFYSIIPRFPTLVAGIEAGWFHHSVVPADVYPEVRYDDRFLAFMTPGELRSCAMRVLYADRTIAVEFFHSLTDGYGATVFLKALLAEYFRMTSGMDLGEQPGIPLPGQQPCDAETVDSFLTHAGTKSAARGTTAAYLPGAEHLQTELCSCCAVYPIQALLEKAHDLQVSLTTFLATVLNDSLMELQQRHRKPGSRLRPVKIMVPVNLRKHFESRTLRNFSLFATTQTGPKEQALSFQARAQSIGRQIKEQLTKEHLQAVMAGNVALERNPILRRIPLKLKCAAIGLGYRFFGERTSSLSLSNLGEIRLPKQMEPLVERFSVYLSPRTISAYNCSVLSFNGKLYLNFSRRCPEAELETIFFQKLKNLGCVPEDFEERKGREPA